MWCVKIAVEVPISIFCDRTVSVFEVLVEFLYEELHLSLNDIARMTNRDNRTIWTVYNRAKLKRKKMPKPPIKLSASCLPLDILIDRKLAVLEAVVVYLKDNSGKSYHKVGEMLNRNERTVWTVYNRAQKKLKSRKSKVRKKSKR